LRAPRLNPQTTPSHRRAKRSMVATRLRAAFALGVVSLALAGCVRVLADTEVHADDTYSQHVIVALTPEAALQLSGEGGLNVTTALVDLTEGEQFSDLVSRYPDQISVSDYESNDLKGVELTIDSLPLDEFNTAAGDLTAGLGATTSITREGDQFVVSLTTEDALELPEMGPEGPDLALLESAIDFEVI